MWRVRNRYLQSGSHEHVSKSLCVPGIHPKNPQVAYTFWTVNMVVIGEVVATDVTAIVVSINKMTDLIIIDFTIIILSYLITFFKKFSSSKFAPSQLTMLPHPVGTERALSPPIIRNRGKPVASPPNPNTTPFLIQPTAVCPASVSVPSEFTRSPHDCTKRLCTWLHIEFQSGSLLCSSWALTTPVEVSKTAEQLSSWLIRVFVP